MFSLCLVIKVVFTKLRRVVTSMGCDGGGGRGYKGLLLFTLPSKLLIAFIAVNVCCFCLLRGSTHTLNKCTQS